MKLQIYNSLSKQKEEFIPINKEEIKIYVCGLTVYDLPHLGHAKLYVVFDVIIRYLRFIGFKVVYVRNITDIDDKIIKRATEEKIDTSEFAEKFVEEMHRDFGSLGLLEPDIEPKATEHLAQIIELIKSLLDKGNAYISKSGDVYFKVNSFKKYGVLSGRDLKGQAAGKRVHVVDDKKKSEDFVLWKMSKDGEPSWSSPWGNGRPGWHIECSAMSMHYLGEYFDIHGGGYDLLFPHHENELAQSSACTGKDFVKYWLHVGFLQLNKDKMSKSTGNFFTIRDVLVKYHPEALRMFLATSHYRSQQNFSYELLEQADSSLLRLYSCIKGLDTDDIEIDDNDEHIVRFKESMNDDFNTSKASAILFELSRKIEINKKDNISLACKYAKILKKLSKILGILEQNPTDFLQYGFSTEDKKNIENIISQRNEARKNKNWELADNLRAKIDSLNIDLEDGSEKTSWRRKATC